MTMIYTVIASLANALWVLLLLPVALLVVQRGVIKREKRYLESRLGEEFCTPLTNALTLIMVAMK